MLLPTLICLLYSLGSCLRIPVQESKYSETVINCITDIVVKYYAPQKVITYVGNKPEDSELLEPIHALSVVAIITKRSSRKLKLYHKGYLITATGLENFTEHFLSLSKKSSWNPDAFFLIVCTSLEYSQLKEYFNLMLGQHVNNVIIMNATDDGHLYSYNPYENYGCGRFYEDIISYGKCSQAQMQNIFPYKYVTELENCTFKLAIPHLPPYAVHPKNYSDTSHSLAYGIEPYFLRLIGRLKGFSLNITLSKENVESDSTVTSDMEAEGPLQMLQEYKVDIILGGQLLVPSNAERFEYVFDLLPYVDEIRFLVRTAKLMPPWKIFYLEFDGTVWLLVILSLLLYSIVMIFLLRAEDKSQVILNLLDNLVLHGCNINCKTTVKWVFIMWVWFAYLVNAFYQSSLFSLATNPPRQKQISTEADILSHKLKPCFSQMMQKYDMESSQSHHSYVPSTDCQHASDSIRKVLTDQEYYTIFLYGLYIYNKQDFFDIYGHDHIYPFKEAYSKVIYCMYFYKGFPFINEIRLIAVRLREMGLVNKAISDMIYLKNIKHHFHAHPYKPRFALPWFLYLLGCVIAGITLVVEIIIKHRTT